MRLVFSLKIQTFSFLWRFFWGFFTDTDNLRNSKGNEEPFLLPFSTSTVPQTLRHLFQLCLSTRRFYLTGSIKNLIHLFEVHWNMLEWPFNGLFFSDTSLSVICKRANLKTSVSRKQSTPNFPKKRTFFSPDTHTYVSGGGGKRRSFFRSSYREGERVSVHFFGKFIVLCFFETPVLRFALLSYYQRVVESIQISCNYNKKFL